MLLTASLADIIEFLQGLPTGLIAAFAFIFVLFFVVLIKLQLDALVKYIEALKDRAASVPEDTLRNFYESLARVERTLDELTRAVERLSKSNGSKEQNSG